MSNYYQASQNAPPVTHPLAQSTTVDALIVGAGMAGLSAALELANRGYTTMVLEESFIGQGASGRSGGQALVDIACGIDKVAKHIGKDNVKPLFHLTDHGRTLIRNRIQQGNIDCDLVDTGALTVALKPAHVRELTDTQALYANLGYETTLLDKAATQQAVNSPLYTGGLLDPKALHIHPLNYTLGLAQLALDAGAIVHTDSAYVSHQPRAQATGKVSVQVRSNNAVHTITTDNLIFCGNCDLGNRNRQLWSKIMPVGTYIAATNPLSPSLMESLIQQRRSVCDINFVLDYFRPSADNRLLFGGRVSYSGLQPPRLAQSLFKRMVRVFPQLADCTIDYCWGGYVDISMNRAPHFGRLSDGVYFAQGFSGHGVALTNLYGQLVAQAIAKENEALDIFSKIPIYPFPGGRLLRTPMLIAATTYYRLRDML